MLLQILGVRRSHFETFEEIRNRRLEGFAAETNKLIIRLDKLLLNLPTDPNRKKCNVYLQYEISELKCQSYLTLTTYFSV